MAYTNNVPQANQQVSQTQSLIQANFMALSSFGNGYAELSLQSVAPSFSASNDGLYTLTNATTSASELYVHKQTVDAPAEVPFTAACMSNTAMAGCLNGWSYLPSGLLIKWGNYLATSNIIFAVNVGATSGGPNYNKVFQTYVTSAWGGSVTATPSIPVVSATGTTVAGNFNAFVTNFDAAKSRFNYLVIGV